MRLNYTVLCIDDQIGTLRDTKRNLSRHNDTVGVFTNFIDVEVQQGPREVDIVAFRKRIFSEISAKFNEGQIDLVIVDLHLGALKGHEVIEHIRGSQTMYRPIVFYSGGDPEGEKSAEAQLQEGLKQNNLVGKSVFLSVRGENLTKDLKGICSEMHSEEHKLNASRGILMDRTSEIDAKVLKHLRKKETWEPTDPCVQKKIDKAVSSEIKRQRKTALKNACLMRELAKTGLEGFTDWICNSTEKEVVNGLNAFSRNNLMRDLLRMSPETKEAGRIHSTYFKQHKGREHLTGIRDVYAHQTEKQIGDEHNEEKCKYIREEIRAHLENVTKVTSLK